MTTVGIQELEPRLDQRPKSQDHSFERLMPLFPDMFQIPGLNSLLV
jgi:hypothetical protein